MTDDEVRARIAAVPHRYHPSEVRPGIITPGANNARTVLEVEIATGRRAPESAGS